MTESLTPKEIAMLRRIVEHNQYGERGDLANHPWSWAVCGTKSWAGLLGSLVQKGFAQQHDTGKDASCHLTIAGQHYAALHFDGVWIRGGKGQVLKSKEAILAYLDEEEKRLLAWRARRGKDNGS